MFSVCGGRETSLLVLFLLIYFGGSPLNAFSADVAQHSLLGEPYKGARPVADDQAQVIYYRAVGGSVNGPANVYLDQEFVTALQSGGYTSFCIRPGAHTMGAYLAEMPRYIGKNEDLYRTTLKGGMTYYLKVREQGGTLPLAVGKHTAEAELVNSRLQVHLLSRASQIEKCRYYGFTDQPAVVQKVYVLEADQLFAGRNRSMRMTAKGHALVGDILKDLQRNDAQLVRMSTEGHTDPMADEASNQLLGQEWANSVRQALIDQGAPQALLSATSAGSRESLKSNCYGAPEDQIICHAPNRRVTVRVEIRGNGTR